VIANPGASADIVAVQGRVEGDRLVVLSGDDGRVIRVLTDDVGLTFGGISATPNGQTIYFARRRAGVQCDRIEIARVSRAGGPVEVIGTGAHPLVSPDGRTLAFIRPPADDPCGPRSEQVWRDLATGQDFAYPISEIRGRAASESFPISWSPDGTRVLFATAHCEGDPGQVNCDDEVGGVHRVVPMRSPTVPEFGGARELASEAPASGGTYLPDGQILIATHEENQAGQVHRLVLFEGWPGPPDQDPPATEDFFIEEIRTVYESREPGVLHIAAARGGDVLLHFGGNLLQRWQMGGGQSVTLAEGIREATWLPHETSTTTTSTVPPPTTTTQPPTLAPVRAVAGIADSTLATIDSNGAIVRRLGTVVGALHNMALAPDGKTLYYEYGTGDRCADGEIVRVVIDEEPLHFEALVQASWMALSPDGTKLAYRRGQCGTGQVVVRDLNNGAEQSFVLAQPNDDGPFAELVGPVAWDTDNHHLMVRVNREPGVEHWYVDTATSGELTGPVFFPRGEQDQATGPTDFEPMGSTGKWIAVYENVGGTSLVEFDVANNTVVRPLAELPTRGVEIAGTTPNGRHVLLLVPSEGGFQLYRWSEGDSIATLLHEGATAADW
jgi:Tol biopolymer transport system component